MPSDDRAVSDCNSHDRSRAFPNEENKLLHRGVGVGHRPRSALRAPVPARLSHLVLGHDGELGLRILLLPDGAFVPDTVLGVPYLANTPGGATIALIPSDRGRQSSVRFPSRLHYPNLYRCYHD